MDILINLLVAAHLIGLVLGVGTSLALIRIRPVMATAEAGQRPVLFKVSKLLSSNGALGLALLWTSGPLLIWLKHGGVSTFDLWFWVKIVLVIALSASVVVAAVAAKKVQSGDASAAPRLKFAGTLNVFLGLAIMVSAVFAFD